MCRVRYGCRVLVRRSFEIYSEFNYYAERPWTTTLIKNFDGEINFEVVHKKGTYEDDSEWYLRGGMGR